MEIIHLNTNIGSTPGVIIEHFSDFKAYAEIHPIIYQSEQLGPNKYLIKEKAFGWFPTRYKAEIFVLDNTIKYKAYPLGILDVEIIYNFELSKNSTTNINEIITVKGFVVFRKILAGYMKLVHQKLFENLDKMYS